MPLSVGLGKKKKKRVELISQNVEKATLSSLVIYMKKNM